MTKTELLKAIREIDGVFRVTAEIGDPRIVKRTKKSRMKALKLVVYFDVEDDELVEELGE